MSDSVCRFCGCYSMDHDYEQLARHCYPEQVKQLRVEIDRLQASLETATDALELWGSTGHVPTDLQSLIVEFRATIALNGNP